MDMKFSGVHHIMVSVGDITKAKEFYESVLDFEETDCPVKDGKRVWYKLGDQELHVNYREDYRPSLGHFALSLKPEDYHKYYEKVKATGYQRVTGSDKCIDGLYRFYVDDPFGNIIEFTDGQLND